MRKLYSKEKKILKLLNYESESIEEDRIIKNSRKRIKKALKDWGAQDNDDLYSILKKEKQKETLRQKKEERREWAENKIYDLVDQHKLITPPTKKEAKELVDYKKFKLTTGYARQYYLTNKRVIAFEKIILRNYRTGVHNNYFYLGNSDKISLTVDSENDWNVYSKNTKYPAKHYHFELLLPYNYSFILIDDRLVFIKGKKLHSNGMRAWWFKQSRGLSVKLVEGYLVKGVLVKKSKRMNTLKKAQRKVVKETDDNQLLRYLKIKDAIGLKKSA